MALNDVEARKYSPQVLTAVDVNSVKIHDGEYGTPDVMNRALMTSISSDAALEAALTYMGRSSSLFTTDTTKFLSHCEGEGLDVLNAKSPTLHNIDSSALFIKDQSFLGAAWPQHSVTNLLVNKNGLDSSLLTNTGWIITSPTDAHVTISYTADGAVIDNSLYDATTPIVAGDVIFSTDKVTLPTDLTAVGALKSGKISVGYTAVSTTNMVKESMSANLILQLFDAEGTVLNTQEVKVAKGEVNGWITIEDVTVPTGTASFAMTLKITFGAITSRGKVIISKAMAIDGSILLPWVATTRSEGTASYDGVVDFNNGDITASCWSMFKQYSMLTHADCIGPLFLTNDYVTIGGAHKSAAQGSLTLALRVKQKGQEAVFGDEFTIPAEYINRYLWSAIRIRADETDTTKAVVEYVAVAGYNIYKSSLTVDKGLIDVFNLALGADFDTTEYFNGPVTEVRYDAEWINDTEAYIISLSRKPFSYKKSNDLGAAESVETVVDVLDRTGVNLLLNPTGRLGLLGWAWDGATPSGFATVHRDPNVGNGFAYVGTATNPYTLITKYIPVKASTVYTLRGIMSANSGATGAMGFGIAWYDASYTMIGTVSRINCVNDDSVKYYKIQATTSATAAYAKVRLYINKGFSCTKALWARMKLEAGDATQFSDDSGASYAVYYGEDDN